MIAPNIAAATSLLVVGRHLDAAAARLDDAARLDESYRWRSWTRRSRVHAHLDQAAAEFQHALRAMPGADSGFGTAGATIERLASSAKPGALAALGPARDPAAHRRQAMRSSRDLAGSWSSVVREGARLLSDPATTPESVRRAALDVARALGRQPSSDDAIRLAAIDELPNSLRPHLPVPVATTLVRSVRRVDEFGFHDVSTLLGSWERRTTMLDQPGFDRRAAVDELARALELDDPQETVRIVAALDQLPANVRPDLPHVVGDWNWTSAQGYRNPGRHQAYVDALRARFEDIRTSADLEPAPAATLDEVARVIGATESIPDLGHVSALRSLPGFPPALVAADELPTTFDVARIRVWLDSQRLAARPDASHDGMVVELQRALDALAEPASHRAGGEGSGAELADRIEGSVAAGHRLTAREALVRIAAIDALPSPLRPDLPELVGVGTFIDAVAHQSTRATDHQRDLLRLRAWTSQFPRDLSTRIEAATGPTDQAARSALRRFLDPSDSDVDAPPLARSEQADVLVQVLAGAGSYSPRLHHGALTAAERYLESAKVRDPLIQGVVDQTLELTRRNLEFTRGIGNPGYGYHPDYAELGRIAEQVKLLRAFEQIDAPPAAGTLRW